MVSVACRGPEGLDVAAGVVGDGCVGKARQPVSSVNAGSAAPVIQCRNRRRVKLRGASPAPPRTSGVVSIIFDQSYEFTLYFIVKKLSVTQQIYIFFWFM
jgi:hypothetical protein